MACQEEDATTHLCGGGAASLEALDGEARDIHRRARSRRKRNAKKRRGRARRRGGQVADDTETDEECPVCLGSENLEPLVACGHLVCTVCQAAMRLNRNDRAYLGWCPVCRTAMA